MKPLQRNLFSSKIVYIAEISCLWTEKRVKFVQMNKADAKWVKLFVEVDLNSCLT